MIQIKEYQSIPVNRSEILRYAGMQPYSQLELLDDCISEALPQCCYRVCYDTFPLTISGDLLDLGFSSIHSKDLTKNLSGCKQIVLFAATVGMGLDRLIEKSKRLSPARALLLQAIGAERVESLCDTFCQEMRTQFEQTRPRYSPGYGDLPLSLQTDIFSTLDCARKIGISLNQSLLMSPSKSVTAIIGILDEHRS